MLIFIEFLDFRTKIQPKIYLILTTQSENLITQLTLMYITLKYLTLDTIRTLIISVWCILVLLFQVENLDIYFGLRLKTLMSHQIRFKSKVLSPVEFYDFFDQTYTPAIGQKVIDKTVRDCLLTLHRKILLCPIYWGTQWTTEISSNE